MKEFAPTIGKKKVSEFIKTEIIKQDNFKTGILDKQTYKVPGVDNEDDRSTQGFFYERLWDLCIKFGVTDLTLPSIKGKLQTSHIFGNPNKDSIEFEDNCWMGGKINEYLNESVRSGNSGGYSDITFLNKFTDEGGIEYEELYFISVKYFKEEKEIGKYDIGKLCTLLEKHKKPNRTIKTCIFVKDKHNAIEKFKAQHSSSNILIKYINPGGNYENVYDVSDLHKYYFNLKKLLEKYNYLKTTEDITNFETTHLNILKSIFVPRFHQHLFIQKIDELVKKGKQNILVGAIPRSGKSYIMAGAILQHIKSNPGKIFKFMIMTPAPNETFREYNDIFSNYIEFNDIDFIEYKDGVKLKDLCPNKGKHCVIVVSKQKLGYKKKESLDQDNIDVDISKKELEIGINKLLGKNEIDMLFLDEAHFGMSTDTAQTIVNILNKKEKMIKVYVTATYNKPLQTYGIDKESKLTWDIRDIDIMKQLDSESINDNEIKKRFGATIYNDTLKYFGGDTGLEMIKEEYKAYPKPYLVTSLWDKDFLNIENLKLSEESDFGWDMGKLFLTEGETFINEEQMKEMMRYYFGLPNKKEDYDKQVFYRSRGIIPRINKICTNTCRTMQIQNKTSQLWFLPLGQGRIQDKVKALTTLLLTNEFKHIKNKYHFYIAVETPDFTPDAQHITIMKNPKEIKKEIQEVEKQLVNGNLKQDNLIILAGNRLQLGISLRNVDIVTLWNSTSSSDAIFQMLFRSMTEVNTHPCKEKTYCNKKEYGFMVDMNPQRALSNVTLFGENIINEKDESKSKFQSIADLINIDEDVFIDNYEDDVKGRERFTKELFDKLYLSWNIELKNIKHEISKFNFDNTILKKITADLKQIHTSKGNVPNSEPEEDDQFQKGKTQVRIGPKPKKSTKKKKTFDPVEAASELLSELISLLNIFTLYSDGVSKCIFIKEAKKRQQLTQDIKDLISEVFSKEKELFLKILNGRLTGNSEKMFNEKIIADILDSITIDSDNNTLNKIIDSEKRQYYNINQPDKLLEFINSKLTPKKEERKEKGEIFTPLNIVDDMLGELDNSYIKINGKSIFTEKHLKWLDPAVGIGNFPIRIYQKLMVGLESEFPNEEERRKHILENMLYMVEISIKSIYILNKIFCGNTYKLNIHTGNFLYGDYYGKMFDVIIGNPPYNPPKKGGTSSGNSIWPHFVFKSYYMLNPMGFLNFIHPPGWKKPKPSKEIFKEDQFLTGEYYKLPSKSKKGKLNCKPDKEDRCGIKQIRQGQVWNVLRNAGIFTFIYTNDQKVKNDDYILHFPAVDYYVYQKRGDKKHLCNTKNIFNGKVYEKKNIKLNYDISYLPNLITNETIDIFNKIINKNDNKLFFKCGIDERTITEWKGKVINWIYDANKKGFQYKQKRKITISKTGEVFNTVDIDKFVINYGGGINSYNVKYIKDVEENGILHMTMYSKVKNDREGKHIEVLFNSIIIKFLFLLTQYASGKNLKNEPLVANTISIPEEGIKDYYKYFNIEEHKTFVEEVFSNYEESIKPKSRKKKPTPKVKTPTPKVKTPTPKVKTQTPKVKTPTPKVKTPTPKVKTKRKKCPRGTRRNRETGECEKVKLKSQKGKGKYRTFKKRKHKKKKSQRQYIN